MAFFRYFYYCFTMKYLYLIFCTYCTLLSFAQAPKFINYQGIARDVNGVPVTGQNINIDFLIYDQLTGGNVIYSETVAKNTDPVSGIFNHAIGNGTPSFGTFSSINWAIGQKFLEIKINGTVLGRQQMMSVPYALYAETSGSSGSQSLQINGNNLSLSGGNTINLPATSVTGSGAASVTTIGTNSFDVFVPQVNITGIGSTSVSGAFPNYSISSTGGGSTNINLSYMPGTGILSYSPAPFPGTLDINPALTFTNGILGVGSNTVNIPGTGLWTKPNATVTSLTNGADWVSIGNNNPLYRMDVTSVGNNFVASRALGFGYAGFLIDRPAINEAGYIIYRNAGSDMWTVGTHVNSSNYMIYNWAFSRSDISVNYSNGYVGISTTTPSTQLHVNGTLTVVDGLQADGKMLVSNASGISNWRSSPAAVAFGSLNQGSTIVSTSPTTLITSAMNFFKTFATSEIVIDVNTRAYNGVFGGGAPNIVYEVRVDGNTTAISNQFMTTNSGSTEFMTIHAVFSGLTQGSHSIHITAYTQSGNSSGVLLDPGGYGGKVIVKEHL